MLWSTSLLIYCNALYTSMSTTWKLQLVQNAVTQIVISWISHGNAHMTLLLHQLHWLPVSFQIQLKMLVITYKALQSIGLGYLRGFFFPLFLFPLPPLSNRVSMLWASLIKQCLPGGNHKVLVCCLCLGTSFAMRFIKPCIASI